MLLIKHTHKKNNNEILLYDLLSSVIKDEIWPDITHEKKKTFSVQHVPENLPASWSRALRHAQADAAL